MDDLDQLDDLRTRALKAAETAQEAMRAYVEAWLTETLGSGVHFTLCRDGGDSWSFWVLEDDTTSYVHEDGRIEWYGTGWTPDTEEHEHD